MRECSRGTFSGSRGTFSGFYSFDNESAKEVLQIMILAADEKWGAAYNDAAANIFDLMWEKRSDFKMCADCIINFQMCTKISTCPSGVPSGEMNAEESDSLENWFQKILPGTLNEIFSKWQHRKILEPREIPLEIFAARIGIFEPSQDEEDIVNQITRNFEDRMSLTVWSGVSKILEIDIVDVIGKEPDVTKESVLKYQWDKLMELQGLKKVKKSMRELLAAAKYNWRCENNSKFPTPITLNKLFVGKPGTGKTTVATIYGNILKELRLLTNGRVLERASSSFIGGYVGQSQVKTRALISAADGKVLLIDEAYVLAESEYGQRALDTIVEMVPNKPGADIAVVMIGYKDEMLTMCNEVNPGLARRFDIDNIVEFEDFTDEELVWILKFHCKKNRVECPMDVAEAAVAEIVKSRPQRTFGNAGTVVNAAGAGIPNL